MKIATIAKRVSFRRCQGCNSVLSQKDIQLCPVEFKCPTCGMGANSATVFARVNQPIARVK